MAPAILLPNEGARIRSTCVMLGLRAFQSFRSIPRSLSIFSGGWIPHFTSIINWALRYGLALLLKPHRLAEPWLAIVDTTFTYGSQILFAVLSTPVASLKARGSALTLEDAHCIGLEVTDKLNREKIAEILNKVFSKTGIPVAIIEDWSSEIHAGAKLWNGKLKDQNVELIRDVGHAAANALEHEYSNLKIFKSFLKTLTQAYDRLKNTELSFLKPTYFILKSGVREIRLHRSAVGPVWETGSVYPIVEGLLSFRF